MTNNDNDTERGGKTSATPLLDLLRNELWAQVLAGLVLGIAVGLLMGPDAGLITPELAATIGEWLALPGHLFLALIRFVVVPLVISSVALGIADNRDLASIRKLGIGVVLYFVITTSIAVTLGVMLTQAIQPGNYLSDDLRAQADQSAEVDVPAPSDEFSTTEAIVSIFPTNPVSHMAEGDMLQIVIAAVIFGLALIALPNKESDPLVDLLNSVLAASMKIVIWLMRFAPIAVFGLLADITARVGVSAIAGVGAYVATVIIGLLCLLGIYMLFVYFLARRSPLQFLSDSREVMLLAFSTSSSSATMPVTLRTVEARHKVHPTVGRLIVPLGATINMDGTAIYQAIATVFIAQAFGIDLGLVEILTILALSIGASIGTPGVPSAGIVILATILISVGVPEAGIGLIFGVDRILDMCRTAVNVTGDMTAATVLERMLGMHKKSAPDERSVAEEPAE